MLAEGEGALTVLEGADEERRRRDDEEHRGEDKERRNAEPGREIGRRDPAGRRWRIAHGGQMSVPASNLVRKTGPRPR